MEKSEKGPPGNDGCRSMVLVPTGAHGKETEVPCPTIFSFASALRQYTELTAEIASCAETLLW